MRKNRGDLQKKKNVNDEYISRDLLYGSYFATSVFKLMYLNFAYIMDW